MYSAALNLCQKNYHLDKIAMTYFASIFYVGIFLILNVVIFMIFICYLISQTSVLSRLRDFRKGSGFMQSGEASFGIYA